MFSSSNSHQIGNTFLLVFAGHAPGPLLTRIMPEDIVVHVERPAPANVVLKKGASVFIDMVSIHRNPHTFPDANKFQPSRWADLPEHRYTTFGSGPRACLGRKFAQIEALTMLSSLLRDWKVDVVLRDGETGEEYEERVMGNAGMPGMTFGVIGEMKVQFTRRTSQA
ncbi:hypothetical protein EST38_g9312 [Candolleomyces aberdarensis]|uniref:Cytochrome P450 n=1 Tax=Candolleomyces aberdarensis TaxID=2316362 RepID=A0A4Q2DA84_9AGAR|nr:hypothetical protein EST38_g9312 [Candolleomyces aberdarensis]